MFTLSGWPTTNTAESTIMEKVLEGLENLSKELAEVKAKCANVSQEMMGTTNGSLNVAEENQSSGLVDKTTLREMMEKMSFQISQVSANLSNSENKPEVSNSGISNLLNFGRELPTGIEIRSIGAADEQALLEAEIVHFAPCLDEENLKDELKTFEKHVSWNNFGYSMTLAIENCLDADLNELDRYFAERYSLEIEPVIASGASSLLKISHKSQYISGSLSYKISGEDLRLAVSINQQTGYLAFAFVPDWLPMSRNVFESDGNHADIWRTMTDKRWCKWWNDPMKTIIRHKEIHAAITFAGGPKSGLEIMVIKRPEAVDLDRRIGSFKSMSSIKLTDGVTLRGKTVSRCLQFLETYGYVVEIENYLNVSLSDIGIYLEGSPRQPVVQSDIIKHYIQICRKHNITQHVQTSNPADHLSILTPDLVTANGRKVIMLKADFCGKNNGGLVTFRIGTTDLRLAIGFELFSSGNKFAVDFIPASTSTNAILMQFLTSDNHWSNSMDHKCTLAKNGEQVIETRNIRASAAMTNSMKALVRVKIKTH